MQRKNVRFLPGTATYIYTFHFEAKNLHGVAELGYCPKVTQDKDVVTGYLLGLDYLIKMKSS